MIKITYSYEPESFVFTAKLVILALHPDHNFNTMYEKFQQHLQHQLNEIESAGLFKDERILISPQGPEIRTSAGQEVLNFCANNYLGFSNNPRLIAAAKATLDSHGYGMSSVRFICGTTEQFNLRGQVEIITGTLGKARIRMQLSAAHTHDQLKKVVAAFEKVGRDLNIVLLA